ncbi:MAG: TauD/TfdA family dioxygenase [Myxococcota bacterium]|nr:TauD/TfdA family dioxygenase [Myxococcota bacterium]
MKPLAPDFYHYEWSPPKEVRIEDEFAVLEWSDGVQLRAHAWWLRENLVEEGGVDAVTREGTLDPALLHPELHLSDLGVAEDGSVYCVWGPEGETGRFHPGWLRHVAEEKHGIRSSFPDPLAWEAEDMTEIPAMESREVCSEDSSLHEWMRILLRSGVARLVGLPPKIGALEDLVARIGPVRESNFGAFWSVRVEDEPTSTAYGYRRLGPHTDLPTRELPPGYQFFHCLENRCEGGLSLLTDGRALARYLREEEPPVYKALTELNWIFFNRSPDHDHRWSGPIIEPGRGSSSMTLRAFYPLRAFPDMDEEEIPVAYRAVRRFHQLACDDRFQIRHRMEEGEVLVLDNRRILHGRDAFPSAGARHFRGCYMDQDEVNSCFRVLERRGLGAR